MVIEEKRPDLTGPYHVFIPGVGGTGVLTLNSLLTWAALIDGLDAVSYDQTGAPQKWGAVLSVMDIARMLTWTADGYPGRKAVGGPEPLTYRQWDARTNQLARALAALGAQHGDRVAFLLPGGELMASLHLAVQKLGAASVPLSVRFAPPS